MQKKKWIPFCLLASGIGMTILHPASLPSAIMQYSAIESFEPFCRTFIQPFFELFFELFSNFFSNFFFIFFLNNLFPIPLTPLQQFVNYAQ
jgi:hypothetical protein